MQRTTKTHNLLKCTIVAASLALPFFFSGCDGDDDNNNKEETRKNFKRVSSFLVCSQIDDTCNTDEETAAEIVAASEDGMMLIYTDSPANSLGFVDIRDAAKPVKAGSLDLEGEPTSVAVKGDYALVGVNTRADFVNVSGHLDVVSLTDKSIKRTIALGGQPDSVAVSPDGRYAAIVIENERDEDLGEGTPPQAPAGYLMIVNMEGALSNWTTQKVELAGLADSYAGDPEPEYVDINQDNIAVITLQENNYLVLVDLTTGEVKDHYSAGAVDLTMIDIEEEEALITQTASLDGVLREPDGVTWIGTDYFATADEGDLNGGSRGFTIFNADGSIAWHSASTLDHFAAKFGHYPDERSGNKGNEPENAEYAVFGEDQYLFINSERSSLIFVCDVANPNAPVYKQVLPAAAGPKGVLAIPSRNLLVAASEEDDRDNKLRSAINIYRYAEQDASYPTIESLDRDNGTPIPWGAMSGLAAHPDQENTLYAIEDSFYLKNRIFQLDVSATPAVLNKEITIKDNNEVFASLTVVDIEDGIDEDHASRINVFDKLDLTAMINDDNSVNIDPEGIAVASDGGFWLASEGSGTVGDEKRPVNSQNLLFKIDANGVIEDVVTLPDALNEQQLRFGFEGLTEYANHVYVAFQRVWDGDEHARIGIYDIEGKAWSFLFYPLDEPISQNGGWVGLSDITSIGEGKFLVLERDNQGGPDAAIKRLYQIDVSGQAENTLLTKTLVRDLIPDLTATGGLVAEKVEGLAIACDGDVFIVNDNDGVDDNSGETQLINLGAIIN